MMAVAAAGRATALPDASLRVSVVTPAAHVAAGVFSGAAVRDIFALEIASLTLF